MTTTGNCDLSRPLIIHIPNGKQFHETELCRNALDYLIRSVHSYMETQGPVLMIMTGDPTDDEIREMFHGEIRVVPSDSPRQRKLMTRNGIDSVERRNIGNIQRAARRTKLTNSLSPLLEPYTPWNSPEGGEAPASLWNSGELSNWDLGQIAWHIGDGISITKIGNAIKQIHLRDEAFKKWEKVEDGKDKEGKEEEGGGINCIPRVCDAIKEIKADKDKYEYESKLLDLITNPNHIEESWADIEIDPKIKKCVIKMASLTTQNPASTYGILKRGRISGGLAYGPPGTGKTHLARVVAREPKAVMIHVSPAEIESCPVGETEKTIKALFNLAKMISPSIIFINESESLLKQRGPDDRRWERTRVSQFLLETDGLLKTEKAPFLLIATNSPERLDSAVLRRVPGRLHVDLPSAKAREKIFSIYMNEEMLASDVSFSILAVQTDWQTGSDIRSICIQAALICEGELWTRGRKESVKYDTLHAGHGAIWTNSVVLYLEGIRDFAKKFDLAAVSRMRIEQDKCFQASLPGR